jgi:adenylate kinase
MRLIIMGPPGAGKGTPAAHIAVHYGIPAISTGDIFRANVSSGTDLGVTAKMYMNAGEYVPDDVTNAMVRARLLEHDAASGLLLDGYPGLRRKLTSSTTCSRSAATDSTPSSSSPSTPTNS